jgi:hypothetical protein
MPAGVAYGVRRRIPPASSLPPRSPSAPRPSPRWNSPSARQAGTPPSRQRDPAHPHGRERHRQRSPAQPARGLDPGHRAGRRRAGPAGGRDRRPDARRPRDPRAGPGKIYSARSSRTPSEASARHQHAVWEGDRLRYDLPRLPQGRGAARSPASSTACMPRSAADRNHPYRMTAVHLPGWEARR